MPNFNFSYHGLSHFKSNQFMWYLKYGGIHQQIIPQWILMVDFYVILFPLYVVYSRFNFGFKPVFTVTKKLHLRHCLSFSKNASLKPRLVNFPINPATKFVRPNKYFGYSFVAVANFYLLNYNSINPVLTSLLEIIFTFTLLISPSKFKYAYKKFTASLHPFVMLLTDCFQ